MNIRSLVKKLIPRSLFKIVEPYGHLAEAIFFNTINGFPAKDIKVIGVTGTNGKTTTSFLIHEMLVSAGQKTGLMTTVAWGVNRDISEQKEHFTNVPVKQLMVRLKKMKQAKVDWLILETTSQALAQNRVWGIKYQIAVMTNITHEHLDYHGTFERYRTAKVKLFKLANKHGKRAGVINKDDPNYMFFASVIKNPITYGLKDADITAKDISLKPNGSSFIAVVNEDKLKIKTHLPGSFNVYNSLAAVGVGRILGLTNKQIEQGINNLKSVEGRMTKIDLGQDFDVIVDFAHTPDSFEKLFKDMRPIVKGRMIVMFGSPGRRDEAKRAIQGEIAAKYADILVLTEEDDRDIDSNLILNQIAEGAKKHGKKLDKDMFFVPNREDAIKFAYKIAKPKDTLLFLGKGHEKTIERADGEHPWNEPVVTRNLLKKYLQRK